MAPGAKPFQLLEINIISAQDLEPVSKKMRTYATAWMNQSRKLTTCVDSEGRNNPTWNDKFVFRVDEDFLRQDTSAVMIEIHAVNWLRDALVGTVRVLVGNLVPPPVRSNNRTHMGMRFVALQVRRPSGRPQGILNIGVALLDSSMRSMPLYRQLSASAVGFRNLMEDPPTLHKTDQNKNKSSNPDSSNLKPILRRSKSEKSELVSINDYSPPNSSLVAVPGKLGTKESSILSITEPVEYPFQRMVFKKGKASSVINGAELRDRKPRKSKGSSVLSDSIVSKESSSFRKNDEKRRNGTKTDEKNDNGSDENPKSQAVDEKSVKKTKGLKGSSPSADKLQEPKKGKPISKYNGFNDYGAPKGGAMAPYNSKYVMGAPLKGHSLLSDSEVGPSPSEVAAVMMAERKYPLSDNQSSMLDGWSMDESVEGLRSKLERWQTDLPPLHDRSGYSSSSYKSSAKKGRSHSHDGGSGLFSCFGNIYGYECQCVCGKPTVKKNTSTKFHSPSATSAGRSFL